jgi:hypothetical protein
MTALSLLEWRPTIRESRTVAQADELDRVGDRIAGLVYEFCRSRFAASRVELRQFHMEDLTTFVAADVQVAPDSPGRILRMLRKTGRVGYRVVNRRESLYELTAVAA